MTKLTPVGADRVIYALMILFLIMLAVALKSERTEQVVCIDRNELVQAGIFASPNLKLCPEK